MSTQKAKAKSTVPAWLNRHELAEFFALTVSYLDKAVIPRLSETDCNRKARAHKFKLQAVAQILIRRPGKGRSAVNLGDEADPLLSGGTSKWLERYRREKTLAARMDNEKLRGELVERAAVRAALVVATEPLQKCLNEMCDPCRTVVQKRARQIEEAFNRNPATCEAKTNEPPPASAGAEE